MSWSFTCKNCGEYLGKTTECYEIETCSNCGERNRNPDTGRWLEDESLEQHKDNYNKGLIPDIDGHDDWNDDSFEPKEGDAVCPNCGASAGPAYLNDEEINCNMCGDEFLNPPPPVRTNNTGSYANRFKR